MADTSIVDLKSSPDKPRREVLDDALTGDLPRWAKHVALNLHPFVDGVWVDIPAAKNVLRAFVDFGALERVLRAVRELSEDGRVRFQDVVAVMDIVHREPKPAPGNGNGNGNGNNHRLG